MTTLDLNDYLNDYVSTPDLTRAATLPSRWYTDPAFLQLEKERIFWMTWQWVGSASLVKRPGDFFTADLLGEPLVITRNQTGELQAFFNVFGYFGNGGSAPERRPFKSVHEPAAFAGGNGDAADRAVFCNCKSHRRNRSRSLRQFNRHCV